MSIESAVFKPDAVSAQTGGNAATTGLLGQSSTEKEIYIVDANPLVYRKTILFSKKEHKVLASSPSGYTQMRTNILVKSPMLLANGLVTVNTAFLQFAADINMTDGEKKTLRELISQATYLAALDAFFNDGSTG